MKNVIDYNELNKYLELSNFYNKELQNSFQYLMKNLNDIKNYYMTDNTIKITEKLFDIDNKIVTIKYNTDKNIRIIENKMIEYKSTEAIVNSIVANINIK